MAGLPRARLGTSVKRKLGVLSDCDGEERAHKRISPFHNTPIQKKAMKRRILKISLSKMREIECPETFLRRSVLINNLSRSLQDDLKDDKIWSRWDWAGDMEMLVPRASNSNPVIQRESDKHSTSCTLLTNTCSSQDSNQWSIGAQSQWLNGDNHMDAQMTPSERERVSRDLERSHDRLAETVDNLTSFDPEFATGGKNPMHNKLPSRDCVTPLDNDNRCMSYCNPTCQQQLCVINSIDSTVHPPNSPDLCLHTRDINKNQLLPFKYCRTKSASDALIDTEDCIGYAPISNVTQVHCDVTQTACELSGFTSKVNVYDKCQVKEPWSFSCAEYDTDTAVTYLDMTSNSVCIVTTETSPLETLESAIPCLQTPRSNITSMDNGVISQEQISPTTTAKCNYVTAAANGCGAGDVTSSCLWNSYCESGSPLPVSPCPSPTSCSVEAESPSSSLCSDQEQFNSQSFRDFDVIYNNLVSVLIGGN